MAPWGVQVSPDGRSVVLVTVAERGIEILPIDGGEVRGRLSIVGRRLRWTPDGRGLSFVGPDARSNIWVQPIAGGPPRQLTSFADRRIASYAWSPAGRSIAITGTLETSDIVLIRGLP